MTCGSAQDLHAAVRCQHTACSVAGIGCWPVTSQPTAPQQQAGAPAAAARARPWRRIGVFKAQTAPASAAYMPLHLAERCSGKRSSRGSCYSRASGLTTETSVSVSGVCRISLLQRVGKLCQRSLAHASKARCKPFVAGRTCVDALVLRGARACSGTGKDQASKRHFMLCSAFSNTIAVSLSSLPWLIPLIAAVAVLARPLSSTRTFLRCKCSRDSFLGAADTCVRWPAQAAICDRSAGSR